MILAAGKGTRMSSDRPKVLHEIEGRPMLAHVIERIRESGCDRIHVVVGYRSEEVIDAVDDGNLSFVRQEVQLGTGHAVMQCKPLLNGFAGTVLVLNGDVPCLMANTIRDFHQTHEEEENAATVLTAVIESPYGYGRIVRDSNGGLLAIVEQKDADAKTQEIREINSGLFCFTGTKLFPALEATDRRNAQSEYYLTDVIAVLREKGEKVGAHRVEDSREVAGVNTDAELEAVRRFFSDRRK